MKTREELYARMRFEEDEELLRYFRRFAAEKALIAASPETEEVSI